MTEYRDEKTGARVRVLTPGQEQDQVIYQTHPMWTPGMGFLVFTSTRTRGKNQPHALDMATGGVRCLVDASKVAAVSASGQDSSEDWTLARKDDCFYFRVGDDFFVTAVASGLGMPNRTNKIATFTGLAEKGPISMSIDADEKVLYVAVTIEPEKRWGLASLELASSKWHVFKETDFRIGHVQANPFTPGLVMFCHETSGDAPQRTWVVNADGSGMRPFYKETYNEWVTHEVWWGPDRAIFTIWPYDDAHKQQPHGVVSADLATGTPTVHAQYPAWHAHGSPDKKWALGDDFDRNIWLIKVETGERRLLTQGHLGKDFKTHPHPSFTPDSKAVVFNSSRNGTEDVFLVEIPEWESLPKA